LYAGLHEETVAVGGTGEGVRVEVAVGGSVLGKGGVNVLVFVAELVEVTVIGIDV